MIYYDTFFFSYITFNKHNEIYWNLFKINDTICLPCFTDAKFLSDLVFGID